MLDFMRRNARDSWLIKIALGIICLVFIFFLGGGAQIGGGGAFNAVTVGDVEISQADYQRALQRNQAYFNEQYGGQLTPQIAKALDIPSLTLNQLVDSAVLRQEAERLGLQAPDDAVRAAITQIDAFHRGGTFSPETYRALLRNQGMTPSAFEESMRSEILTDQLSEIVRTGAHVTEEEAFAAYLRDSREMTLSYITLDADSYMDSVTVDEEGLVSFFEENAEQYRQGETVRVRYIPYTIEHFAKGIEPSEEAINEYYELNKDKEFTTQEEISARHILKKFDADADEETRAAARTAIDDIAVRIAGGEDFATLAIVESEDIGSAVKGGDLGSFGRGRMVPPFEKAAFALEVDEVSDVVESDFGFHIIKVYGKTEAGTKDLADVRDEVIQKLAAREAKDVVFDAAAEDAAALTDGATLDEVAESRDLTIEETPLLGRGDIVPGLGQAPAFIDAAIGLNSAGDKSEPIKIDAGYALLELAERKNSYIPELDAVREEVTEGYKAELAAQAAAEAAEGIVADLVGGKALEDVASEMELEVEETGAFTSRGAFIPKLGNIEGLKDAAFATSKDGEALPKPFVHRKSAYIFVRSSLTEGDEEGFEAEREDRIAQIRQQKEQQALGAFLRQVKAGLEIEYNADYFKQVLGDRAPS